MSNFRYATLASLFLAIGASARGDDHFLVIGGGYEPSGNQVSLEKNVLLFRTLLGELYPSGAASEVFFSDGDDPARDLQYLEPVDALPRVNLLLARVFRQTDALGESYRSHAVSEVRGGSNSENLRRWFAEEGQALKAGDRLLIYATAHGGPGPKTDTRDTSLLLWNREDFRVHDLAAQIEGLPEGVDVVLVMVQCYAGGFADLIFDAADREAGVAEGRDVCGFFATTFDRPAAGCTPDIDEENYHEYSTYFWEAIRGRTRLGEPAPRDADLDGDGHVGLAEAHAYTLLESVTVDIPVKTSDEFLRRFSKSEGPGLLSPDSPYPNLLAVASPIDRAVLEGLSETLGLSGIDRADDARKKAEASQAEKGRIGQTSRDLRRRYGRAAGPIQAALQVRWPELKNRWNPRVAELLTDESDQVVEVIESHPDYDKFERLRLDVEANNQAQLDQDRVWVKCQRLLRTLENVALAANLPRVASPEIVARYHHLVESESAPLGSPTPALAGGDPAIPSLPGR